MLISYTRYSLLFFIYFLFILDFYQVSYGLFMFFNLKNIVLKNLYLFVKQKIKIDCLNMLLLIKNYAISRKLTKSIFNLN